MTPPPPSSAAGAAKCDHCVSDDRWILHNVRLRGKYLKLCTSCVLKLHPTSFCPTCFSLHDPLPSTSINAASKTLTCFKCSSLSHSTCVPPNVPKSPYLCPPCANPSFKFFDLRKPRKARPQSNCGDCSNSKNVPEGEQGQPFDQRAARIFLAAAKIAANSMNKAAAVAKMDADRRVKEAAVAKKRAKEALDHFMVLSARASGSGSRPISNPNPVSRSSNNVGAGRATNGGAGAVVPPETNDVNVAGPSGNGPLAGAGSSGIRHLQNGGSSGANVSGGTGA